MSAEKNASRSSVDVVKNTSDSADPYYVVYLQKAGEDLYEDGSVDPVYQAKAKLLNAAIQEVGMGKYQVCGLQISMWSN